MRWPNLNFPAGLEVKEVQVTHTNRYTGETRLVRKYDVCFRGRTLRVDRGDVPATVRAMAWIIAE